MAGPVFAYRTGGDTEELSDTPRVRFAEEGVFLTLNDEVPDGMSRVAVEDALVAATRPWIEPECSVFRFTYAGATNEPAKPLDGINTIQWVEDWDARGFEADAAATTDVQYSRADGHEWVIDEADVYLNAALEWTPSSVSGSGSDVRGLTGILQHELGHVLGLMHPCEPHGERDAPDCEDEPDTAESVMYPLYSGDPRSLSDDDVAGLCFLYPLPACGEFGCAVGETCTEQGCVSLCDGAECALGAICTPDGCRNSECSNGCSGAACSVDADCGPGEACGVGTCRRVPRSCSGDLCAGAEGGAGGESAAGASSGGAGDEGGKAGEVSGASGESGGGAPAAAPSPFGAPCADSSECADGVCVSGAFAQPICTRACGSQLPGCPANWSCQSTPNGSVCAPVELAVEDSGCSLPARGAGDSRNVMVVLAAAAAAAWASRRRASGAEQRRSKENGS